MNKFLVSTEAQARRPATDQSDLPMELYVEACTSCHRNRIEFAKRRPDARTFVCEECRESQRHEGFK